MEPRLNIKIADMFMEPFNEPNPVDVDFIPPGAQMDNDFIDTDSDETAKFQQIEDSFRSDQAAELDRDNAIGQTHGQEDAFGDGTGAQFPYQRAAGLSNASRQAQGFSTRQKYQGATLGVLASVANDTLAGGRVRVKTAKSDMMGTVIAVGDTEFAVIWDDRRASVERKSDYELVVKNSRR
jgi:hypothetical protein